MCRTDRIPCLLHINEAKGGKKRKKKDSYETGNKFTELDLVEVRQQFLKMHICDKGCLEYLT